MKFVVEVDIEGDRWDVEITDPQGLQESRVFKASNAAWQAAQWIGERVVVNAEGIERADRASRK